MERQLQLRNKYLFRIILLFWFYCFSNSLYAQQLLGIYEFTGSSTQATKDNFSAVTPKSEFASFSPFNRSTSVEWASGKDVYNNKSWDTTNVINKNDYIEFTVSAGAAYKVHISRISFEHNRSPLGPNNIRIASNNGSADFDKFFSDFTSDEKSKTTPWDGGEVIIDLNKSVTFRIYGWNAGKGTGTFRVDNVSVFGTTIPNIRINEFHYANTANTGTGFVEVIVPKSFTALNTVTLALYSDADNNSFADVFKTETLDKFQLIDTTMYDDYNVFYLNVPEGLPDPIGGISLTTPTDFIQFLSYGAPAGLEAVTGPAGGKKSTDIGVTEAADDGPNNSIFFSEGRIQAWTNNENGANTKGFRNGEENIILPVELMYFRGKNTEEGVLLTWATATEKNNDKFIVERSNNIATDFSPIAEVKGQGSTWQEQKYQFLDQDVLSGTTYYRLKQIDFDGKYAYSNIVAVNGKEVEKLTISPNPVDSDTRVTYRVLDPNKPVELLIYNITGAKVYQKEYAANYGTNTIHLALNNLPAGTYLLVLMADDQKQTTKFIKR